VPTQSKPLLDIIDRLPGLDVAETARGKFKRLVYEVGVFYGIRGLDHADRIDFARRLLKQKEARATIRDRLMVRYEVSRRQAYRIIDDGLELCQKQPSNGTPIVFNLMHGDFPGISSLETNGIMRIADLAGAVAKIKDDTIKAVDARDCFIEAAQQQLSAVVVLHREWARHRLAERDYLKQYEHVVSDRMSASAVLAAHHAVMNNQIQIVA
jgi:hypothetical protein